MVFSKGYNRRDSKWIQPLFTPLPLGATGFVPASLTSEIASTPEKPKQETESTPRKAEPMKHSIAREAGKVQKPLLISDIRDPKNKLSSLIKNASKNKKALDQRNERIQKTKQQSKSRYGW
ncbi:hypothetical protein C6P45_001855 [Maudiozyma exigua]|uniref:Uncharacterized protein n=1 Tax=Maudiozyma exigua TaxID=34358 RepID=A0A9P6VZE1_MAUEX|nr:hypothetical protein C6P45_001855 [Kazachstania exigua]